MIFKALALLINARSREDIATPITFWALEGKVETDWRSRFQRLRTKSDITKRFKVQIFSGSGQNPK